MEKKSYIAPIGNSSISVLIGIVTAMLLMEHKGMQPQQASGVSNLLLGLPSIIALVISPLISTFLFFKKRENEGVAIAFIAPLILTMLTGWRLQSLVPLIVGLAIGIPALLLFSAPFLLQRRKWIIMGYAVGWLGAITHFWR